MRVVACSSLPKSSPGCPVHRRVISKCLGSTGDPMKWPDYSQTRLNEVQAIFNDCDVHTIDFVRHHYHSRVRFCRRRQDSQSLPCLWRSYWQVLLNHCTVDPMKGLNYSQTRLSKVQPLSVNAVYVPRKIVHHTRAWHQLSSNGIFVLASSVFPESSLHSSQSLPCLWRSYFPGAPEALHRKSYGPVHLFVDAL